MTRMLIALILSFSILSGGLCPAGAEPSVTLWFTSDWSDKIADAQKIVDELGSKSGLKIVPRIAGSNPEILNALMSNEPQMAFVGSMVAAIIWSRRLAQPLFQAVDGRHLYAGEMIFPRGQSPEAILKQYPEAVAYNLGFTSGEVCAKAATGGRAALGTTSFEASAVAVQSGKAKAAFVKDFWWDDNRTRYPDLDSALLPGVSESKNPDNVMLVSVLVPPEVRGLLMDAAYHAPALFNAPAVVPFDSSSFDYTLSLINKAGIDPQTHAWPR